MSKREEDLLAMAMENQKRVSRIKEEIDIHKRYDSHDSSDKYGQVIKWVHKTGTKIFSE
jgi:hypothetical protein